MGKRNMEQLARKAEEVFRKNENLYQYCMSLDEMGKLMELCEKDSFTALDTAFAVGFVAGIRAHSRKRVPVI